MSEFDADVVIIGSGALGANAAYQLAKAGKSVIMLEAGPYIPRWKVVENYRNGASKRNWCAPYPNLPWAPNSYTEGYIDAKGDEDFEYVTSYLRVAGGSTRHWASACWRLLPNDFKLKSVYGVGRDWPFEYGELEPWYVKAEREIGVVGTGEEDQSGQGVVIIPRDLPSIRCRRKRNLIWCSACRPNSARWAIRWCMNLMHASLVLTMAARPVPEITTASRSARLVRCTPVICMLIRQ